ncbi:flagellin [Gemmobacter lanyuensis]|uniref:Flagellin n=1 Tax=Gemmobacter lanyuensis TaxID=1054497 RepID=A0A918MJ14_9RHOB|nr:flagellin [Gemmobacter lanyuensis]GGW25844.1 flagellin [Gemmobacter lanyuensis]
MSSILTNTSAMVALQTLKGINGNLEKVQSEISTGKSVASAKDNAAVWAISKVMESDVKGFDSISDSLELGTSTVSVARQASETVTKLLTDMKGKIVASQEQTADRAKLQTDIEALTEQVKSVVGAAQFNGLNLVNGSASNTNTNGNTGINVLSSLDRASNGSVTASYIGVDAQNLSTRAGTDLSATIGASVSAATLTASGGASDTSTLTGLTLQGGGGALAKTDAAADPADSSGLIEGDALKLRIGSVEGAYTVKAGDTADSILAGLKNSLTSNGFDSSKFSLDITTSGSLTVTNESNVAGTAVEFSAARGNGALSGLESMDVQSDAGAAAALASIETMIQAATDASAAFGSSESRLNTQQDFVSKMSDALTTGISSLVDADMEEASARLQALQTQQQLGVQALSIANQAPQSILSLFR